MRRANEFWRGSGLSYWLDIATHRLAAAGVVTPRHDAQQLAAFALGVPWSDVVTDSLREPFGEGQRVRLEDALARRERGEPLAYIEGSRGFYGLELRCGPGVLVPRPETETVVDVVLELVDGVPNPVVVDLGTGTGAIALAVASKRPDAEIVATDASEEALGYARDNAAALGLDVWFACGDLFDAVPDELCGRVDVVVSNPPYVRDDAELPVDVRAEPALALFGGPDGTDVLRRIAGGAPAWLKRGGAIVLEIGEADQASVLADGTVRDDLTGRPRVIWKRP